MFDDVAPVCSEAPSRMVALPGTEAWLMRNAPTDWATPMTGGAAETSTRLPQTRTSARSLRMLINMVILSGNFSVAAEPTYCLPDLVSRRSQPRAREG